MNQRKKKDKQYIREMTKRYLLFIISLFFAALGVAITKKG